MAFNPINPIASYTALSPGKVPSLGGDQSSGKSFGDFIKNAVQENVSAVQNFEKTVHASTTGKVSELDVISAANEAEVHLQTFKVCFEKFIQEYKNIEKLSI
jgi:flagellar hook-basal body complex protein FliE